MPYTFYVNDVEVEDSLAQTLVSEGVSCEGVVSVSFQPLAIFKVRPVVRCTDTMPGHTEVGTEMTQFPLKYVDGWFRYARYVC